MSVLEALERAIAFAAGDDAVWWQRRADVALLRELASVLSDEPWMFCKQETRDMIPSPWEDCRCASCQLAALLEDE